MCGGLQVSSREPWPQRHMQTTSYMCEWVRHENKQKSQINKIGWIEKNDCYLTGTLVLNK